MYWRFWDREERLRRQAADWFARRHGPDADRAAFERWLAEDPTHVRAYDNIKTTWELAEGLREAPIARTRSLPENDQVRPARAFPWGLSAAAALNAVAIVAWTIFPNLGSGGQHGDSPSQIATVLGEIRTIRLADGSTVTLDTNTALQVAFSSDSRRIVLERGRARFAVAHDIERPFMVDAGVGRVIARGTVFDVSRFSSRVDVALLSGAVAVEILNARHGAGIAGQTEHLNPGEQLSFATDDPSQARRRRAASPPEWPSGMLEFEETPLREVLAETNRYSQTKIRLGEPALGELRVTGAYRAGDTVDLARSLAAIFSLRLSRTREGDFVLGSAD